jgi:hypothetical protein
MLWRTTATVAGADPDDIIPESALVEGACSFGATHLHSASEAPSAFRAALTTRALASLEQLQLSAQFIEALRPSERATVLTCRRPGHLVTYDQLRTATGSDMALKDLFSRLRPKLAAATEYRIGLNVAYGVAVCLTDRDADDRLSAGPLAVSPMAQRAWVDGREIELTPPYALSLVQLIRRFRDDTPGALVTKEEVLAILRRVTNAAGDDLSKRDTNLTNYIDRLRAQLGIKDHPRIALDAVRGQGFELVLR